MRLWRKIAGVAAILGMLFHVGLVVHQHVGMLSAHFAEQELSSALGVICHGSGGTIVLNDSEDSKVPSSEKSAGCPLCLGFGSAVALLSVPPVVGPAIHRVSIRIGIVAEIVANRLTHLRPPTRGPPSSV